MQRASPTMITPVRYAGWFGSSSQASANISNGPITHERNSETPKKSLFETPSCCLRPRSS